VSGQLHAAAALSPWKEPLSRIGYEAGWASEPFCTDFGVANDEVNNQSLHFSVYKFVRVSHLSHSR
jgi:hypothetical protein